MVPESWNIQDEAFGLGSHYWNYYTIALSFSQYTAIDLKIEHP